MAKEKDSDKSDGNGDARLKKKKYEKTLAHLHVELVKLQ